jgi:hypothetical protein
MSGPRLFITLQTICDHTVCSSHAHLLVCLRAAAIDLTPPTDCHLKPPSMQKPIVFTASSALPTKTRSALERAVSVLSP